MEQNNSGKRKLFFRQFNWRMIFVRVIVNGTSLLIITALLPRIYLPAWTPGRILLLGAILGLLNAFVRPILQFLTLSFIFVTYGLVVVLINTLILLLMALLFPSFLVVESLFWATVGGALMGLIATALESLLGLSFPIVPDGGRSPVRVYSSESPSPAVQTLIETRAARKIEQSERPEEEP